jgi:hypothetical protein
MKSSTNFIKKSLIVLIFVCLAVALESLITEGKITEIKSCSNFSIIEYVDVSANYSGQILVRRVRLKIINNSEVYLYNVRAILQSAPNGIILNDPEVILGNIAPGEILESEDDFTISVDESKQITENIFVWKIEYKDVNENYSANEVILLETTT